MAWDDSTEDETRTDAPERSGSRFIRRLIPTVAAASLSFTGCLPGGGGNNGNNGNSSDTQDFDGGSDVGDVFQPRDVRDTAGATPIASINDNGRVETTEIRDLCRGFSQCDPQYFSETFGTIDDCVQTAEQSLRRYIDGYEQQFGAECADAYEAFLECQLGTAICLDGQATYDNSTDCYTTHDYSSVCGGG
jgi:hypothetical protein